MTFSKKKYSTTTNGTAPTRKLTYSRPRHLPTKYAPMATASNAMPQNNTCTMAAVSENQPCENASSCDDGAAGASSGSVSAGSVTCVGAVPVVVSGSDSPGSVSGTLLVACSGVVALGGRTACALCSATSVARDDEPLACRVRRGAGGERERGHVGGDRGDDLRVLRRVHHRAAGDGVDEPPGQRVDLDEIAGLHLVEVEERLAVGGAVTSDGGVAELAGQRRLGEVARALLEVGHAHALDDGPVEADRRDAQLRHRLALGDDR